MKNQQEILGMKIFISRYYVRFSRTIMESLRWPYRLETNGLLSNYSVVLLMSMAQPWPPSHHYLFWQKRHHPLQPRVLFVPFGSSLCRRNRGVMAEPVGPEAYFAIAGAFQKKTVTLYQQDKQAGEADRETQVHQRRQLQVESQPCRRTGTSSSRA